MGFLLRLYCAEDNASSVEIFRIGFMRRATEDIDHAADPNICESRRSHNFHVLLDEERSRNSTCPQVDVGDRVIRQRLLDDDVGDLKPSARPQDPIDLPKDRQLVGAKIDDTVRNHDIHA